MSERHQLRGLVVCDRYPKAMGAIPGYGRLGSTSTPEPDPDADSDSENKMCILKNRSIL